MKRKLLIGSFVLVFFLQSFAVAGGLGSRWRARARRTQTSSQRATYQYRGTTRNYRPTTSNQPWYINSEPAFRSYRTQILYTHLGYPYAFGH